MNAPDRHTTYLLEDGERRIDYRVDTRITNAGTFTFVKEGHTVGDVLRMQILRNRDVTYCGYQLPHPLEPRMLLKVRASLPWVCPALDRCPARVTELLGPDEHETRDADRGSRGVHLRASRRVRDHRSWISELVCREEGGRQDGQDLDAGAAGHAVTRSARASTVDGARQYDSVDGASLARTHVDLEIAPGAPTDLSISQRAPGARNAPLRVPWDL